MITARQGFNPLNEKRRKLLERFNDRTHPWVVPLTRRQLEIIDLVARGYTAEEIGSILFLSHRTVKNTLWDIYKQLDVPNGPAAVAVAVMHGWVDPLSDMKERQ